jgi:hypothetical protein
MGKLSDVQIRKWLKAGQPVAKADGDGSTKNRITFLHNLTHTTARISNWRLSDHQAVGRETHTSACCSPTADLELLARFGRQCAGHLPLNR